MQRINIRDGSNAYGLRLSEYLKQKLWENEHQWNTDDGFNRSCLNCSLIMQGHAYSYTDNRCPQCGNDTWSAILY